MVSEHLSNTDRAMLELRRMIFSGELAPGSNHFEQVLAERLGVSRTPIREAALLLEGQGLVEIQPRRGIRINGISAAEMSGIYDVLSALEALAATRVAEHVRDGTLAPARLMLMREATDQLAAALEREDREAWATADEVFHSELVRLADNAHLETAVSRSKDQVRRARMMTLHLRPLPVRSTEDHKAVLTAIEQGDGAAAGARHAAHRQAAKREMLGFLEKLGRREF